MTIVAFVSSLGRQLQSSVASHSQWSFLRFSLVSQGECRMVLRNEILTAYFRISIYYEQCLSKDVAIQNWFYSILNKHLLWLSRFVLAEVSEVYMSFWMWLLNTSCTLNISVLLVRHFAGNFFNIQRKKWRLSIFFGGYPAKWPGFPSPFSIIFLISFLTIHANLCGKQVF